MKDSKYFNLTFIPHGSVDMKKISNQQGSKVLENTSVIFFFLVSLKIFKVKCKLISHLPGVAYNILFCYFLHILNF